MRSLGVAAALVTVTLLSACASHAPSRGTCLVGERRSAADLYFGLAVKDAPDVTDAQFAAFLDREVTPRFPDGLTVIDAQGRWRGADGRTVKEASKIVQIVLPGGPDDLARLKAIREAYRREFHQDSVLQSVAKTCADF